MNSVRISYCQGGKSDSAQSLLILFVSPICLSILSGGNADLDLTANVVRTELEIG